MTSIPDNQKAIEAQLLARKKELEESIAAGKDEGRPVELDQTRIGRLSRMDALQQQAMSQETERRRKTELARVTSALERLETGDFGYCVTCGEEIAENRLSLDPTLPTCIDCARGPGR